MERNKVVLVDRKDNAIGEMEKLLAHQQGELHRAVQRGERLDDSVVGHGLGLAIVADKVEAYKGTLRFDSNEQGGLTVRIDLPWH